MNQLEKMTDRELAEYQAGYKPGTGLHILAEQEFIRRQGMPAGRRAWIAIWISLGALGLSALSVFIAYFK